jgi:hypothetical protein
MSVAKGLLKKEGGDNFFLHLTGGSVPEYFFFGGGKRPVGRIF